MFSSGPNFPSSTILVVLKYAGSIVAAAYGVYATVTDFKEKKHGINVLSNKGRWGIVLFLFSIVLNLASDGLKDVRDRNAAAEEIDRQRAITDSLKGQSADLTEQRAVLKENLSKVQDLAKSLQTTSERLQRGIVGRLTKVDSVVVEFGLHKEGMAKIWSALDNQQPKVSMSESDFWLYKDNLSLNIFWCAPHMQAGRVSIPITPQIMLRFEIRKDEKGVCQITEKSLNWGRNQLDVTFADRDRFSDAARFRVDVNAESFKKLNPNSSAPPDAQSFFPNDEIVMIFGPVSDQLSRELQQMLPSSIQLDVFPNGTVSPYATHWKFGDREIVTTKDYGGFIGVQFKPKQVIQ